MLCTHFLRRGYPEKIVLSALDRALKKDRNSLLEYKPKHEEILESNNYSKKRDTKRIIILHRNSQPRESTPPWHCHGELGMATEILGNQGLLLPITFATRRNKNLKDMLVRASTTTKSKPKAPHVVRFPCNEPGTCNHCPRINKSGWLVSTSNGRKYRTLYSMNCQSCNLIYAITYKYCKLQYVGQKVNRLMDPSKRPQWGH